MPRNRLIPGLALVGLVAALGAWYAATRLRPPPTNGTLLPAGAPADFTLAAEGGPVRLSDFRGRTVLLFFGYTSCPDVCPITMAKLRQVVGTLDEDREAVQVLLVSVDPEVDTPDRLGDYVRRFDPAFTGLTGSRPELTAAARSFGAYAGEVEEPASAATATTVPASHDGDEGHSGHGGSDGHAGAPTAPETHSDPARVIPHTAHVFGLDREGRFRMLWAPDLTAEQIATDVRALLRL